MSSFSMNRSSEMTLLRKLLEDLISTFYRLPLVFTLGWQDIRGRYRRSAIGPFWLTISMGIMIACIGLVFGQIFDAPMKEYLPFLALGIILWGFITGIINEGCMAFIEAEGIIKQLPIPLFVHILRVIWRNVIILAHNILILPLIFVIMGKNLSPVSLWAILGLSLVVMCLSWIALFFAILCARYRDLSQIVLSLLQIAFYLTPIMWMPSSLPNRFSVVLLDMNPFYHILELIRAPLLGQIPELTSWTVVALITLLGWLFVILIFSRLHKRVAYWL